MIYPLVRSLLFRLDAEAAHELTAASLERLQYVPAALTAIERLCRPDCAASMRLLDLPFATRVGIAAGFDKNGTMLHALAALGFGYLEVGTVTYHAQPGNPRPRLFRYPHSRALVNRLGFNNDGARAVADRLARWRATAALQPPLFVNIGKNRDVPLANADASYGRCYAELARFADVCVLNLSSPNTPGLRDLQKPEQLVSIIRAVRGAGPRRPLFVKIAPDIDDALLDEISDACVAHADGMICTNTTVSHGAGGAGPATASNAGGATTPPFRLERGGLSGAPLLPLATEVLRKVRRRVGNSYPLVGVGGIMAVEDARMKIEAGADLVQIYTGFIYEGPAFPFRLGRALASRKER